MEIKSRQNPKVRHMKKLSDSRKYRLQESEFFCDGAKLLQEAVESGLEITCIMASGDINYLQKLTNKDIICVSREIIDYISPMVTPQDIIFSCKIPKETPIKTGKGIIVLENIQDPGNLGALLRSANAFNMEKVILTGDCADLYNPKTIRASMGAVFKQTVFHMDIEELYAKVNEWGLELIGAALSERAEKITDTDISKSAIVIGSEGSGLSEKIREICQREIIIPMSQGAESLNAAVAASIIMWEIYRR